MQNYTKENINLQHKCIVVIMKPKYRINNVFSWVTQNVDSGKITDKTTILDITKFKKEMADETAFRLNRFIKSNNNKKGVLIDPFKDYIEIPYYIVGDNLNTINMENNNYISNPLYSNDRVVSCNITQETDTNWSCNITLNNTDDIYTLNNEYYYKSKKVANTNFNNYILNQENTCVIEPNDEVHVFMSNWKGKLNSVFTGLVSTVTLTDDGLNKSVNLQCSDMFKKLSWTYKVVKASFDTKEAFGTSLSVYEQNYASKSLSEVVTMLLGETLCDIYKRDTFLLRAIKSYIQNKDGNKDFSLSKEIQKEINEYIKIEKVPKELKKEKDSSDILRIIGYKCTYKIINTNLGNKVVLCNYKEGDIAFKVSGMEQPAWAWTINSGSFDFLFSTFQRNDEFVRNIANIVAYEVFADVSGIVLFRPPNLVLPRKVDFKNKEFTKEYNEYLDNYLVTQDKEENYFISFATTTDDNAIKTQVAVTGALVENNITFPTLKSKAYAPIDYINKYGIRMMQPVTRVGLKTDSACEKYGDLLLWRQNKNYELASAACILNSDYTVGMPIFINKYLAVWYIKRVNHTFSAGNICTTELTLGYKRMPLCYKKDLQTYLSQSLEKGKISQTQYDTINKNRVYLTWGILNLNYDYSQTYSVPIAETTGTIQGEQIIIGKGELTKKYNPNDMLLVWEPLPIELYDDIMEYNYQNDGAKSNKSRINKVTKILTTKANENIIKFTNIVPPLDMGGGSAFDYDVNVSNSTTTVTIKREQIESLKTTDADIQKEVFVEPKEFTPKEFENNFNQQILVVPPPISGFGL